MTTWSKSHPHLVHVPPSFTSIMAKPSYSVTLFLYLILKSTSNRAERITLLKCKSNCVNLLKFTIAYSALKTRHCYTTTLRYFLFSHLLLHDEPNHTHLSAFCSKRNTCYSLSWELPSPTMTTSLWLLHCASCPHFQQSQRLHSFGLLLLPGTLSSTQKPSINICSTNDAPQTELSSPLLTQSPPTVTTFSSEES